MALVMGKWGCWLAVAVHVVVRGKEAMIWQESGIVWHSLAESGKSLAESGKSLARL